VPSGLSTLRVRNLPAGCEDPGLRSAIVSDGEAVMVDIPVVCQWPVLRDEFQIPASSPTVRGPDDRLLARHHLLLGFWGGFSDTAEAHFSARYGMAVVGIARHGPVLMRLPDRGATSDSLIELVLRLYSDPWINLAAPLTVLPSGKWGPIDIRPLQTTTRIQGTVSSRQRGPIAHALVSVKSRSQAAWTDTAGFYAITEAPRGVDTLVVSELPFECADPGPIIVVTGDQPVVTTVNFLVGCTLFGRPLVPNGFRFDDARALVAAVPHDTAVLVLRDHFTLAFWDTTSAPRVWEVLKTYAAEIVGGYPFTGAYIVRVPDPGNYQGLESVLARIRAEPGVRGAYRYVYREPYRDP
jgi:hypothetical protein